MLKEEKAEMQETLEKLYNDGIFRNKYIVIFGSNEPAERIASWLLSHAIRVEVMIDNNKKKQGTFCMEIPVDSPENILGTFRENAVILIASKYYNEMAQQLGIMGYKEEKHIFKIVDMAKGSTYSVTEETFTEKENVIYKGWDIYKKIRKKYGQETRIFICPYPALGDVYLTGMYLEKYCEKNNIPSYAVIVTSNACMQILLMFGIKQAEKLPKEESDLMVQSLVFAGLEECNVEILHHRFPYTVGIGVLGNYKGICFNDHYKYSIFGMYENEKGKAPKKTGDRQYINSFFKENGLIEGKTVIISPYANTSSNLPESFWKRIIKEYQKKGYIVCTNSSGTEEPAIEGTKAVTFPLSAAVQVIEMAGIFIGLRSGLCDVISQAHAKKIILYPDRIYQGGEYIGFYSLKNMGLCMDAEERVVEGDIQREDLYV